MQCLIVCRPHIANLEENKVKCVWSQRWLFNRRFLGAKQDWGIVYETSLCDFSVLFKKIITVTLKCDQKCLCTGLLQCKTCEVIFPGKKKVRKISICIRKYFLACFICYGSHEQIFWRLKTGGEITQVPYLMVFLKKTLKTRFSQSRLWKSQNWSKDWLVKGVATRRKPLGERVWHKI